MAGTGSSGFSGDGGPATGAELDGPAGVALDASGNLYIVELGGHRIRKVSGAASPSTPTCPQTPAPPGATLSISPAASRPGDSLTVTASGTPGETAAIAYSRANAGASFRGQALLLGTDLAVLFTCRLSSAGSCSQTFGIPPSTSGTFFFQAGRSSDPTFGSGTFSLTNGACVTIQ